MSGTTVWVGKADKYECGVADSLFQAVILSLMLRGMRDILTPNCSSGTQGKHRVETRLIKRS